MTPVDGCSSPSFSIRRLGKDCFNTADASARRFFFNDLETLTVLSQLAGVVDVRPATDLEAEWLVSAVGNHLVDLHGLAVAVTELAQSTHVFASNFGWVFGKANL